MFPDISFGVSVPREIGRERNEIQGARGATEEH
jgi:hypothetical protein